MDEASQTVRKNILEHIALVASAEAQLEYERVVPNADVPSELICVFADDLYHPKFRPLLDGFSEAELKDLAEFYGRLCVASDAFQREGAGSVSQILKLPEWRSAMALAKELCGRMGPDS